MTRSMTGYGKGRSASEAAAFVVEIKTVNHRYCDITLKAPRQLLPFEPELKKAIGARIKRGKVDVFITQELSGGGEMAPVLNRPLAAAYVRLFEELQGEFPVTGGIPLALLAGQKDVIVPAEGGLDEEAARPVLLAALEQALEALCGMRAVEGAATRDDIAARLVTAEELMRQVGERAPLVPQEWQQRLQERLARLQGELEVDPQRLAQEVALYADRCDISEELARFQSHLQQFRLLLDSDEPVGRQMDFLVQELNREVNTTGSKANDAELARLVVEIKAELEKIREQVQNLE